MEVNEITQDESRRARLSLFAVAAASVLIVGGQALVASSLGSAGDRADALVERNDATTQVLIGSGIGAIGLALLVIPLMLLFDAARRRADTGMARYRLLVMLGPPVFALAQFLTAIAINGIATDFAAGTPPSGDEGEDRADELFADSVFFQLATGIGLAGIIAMVFGTIYSALWGMRTGLVTRFWGTLGMAFGAFFLLGSLVQSPIGLLGTLFFLLHVALVAGGRWPGPQPPAWAAGEAVPWDGSTKVRATEREEELARPEDFEHVYRDEEDEGDTGEGREGDEAAEGGAGDPDQEPERPAGDEGPRKRKRKQRRP